MGEEERLRSPQKGGVDQLELRQNIVVLNALDRLDPVDFL